MESVLHSWELTTAEARQLQEELAAKIRLENDFGDVRTVAGVDVGFEGKTTARAAVVVLSYPELSVVDFAIARQPVRFPYVPGYLSFRECPVILEALDNLSVHPDLLLCDGQGIAHPRRFGVACHLGLLTDIPAIGVAKSRLIGAHDTVPEAKGSWVPLIDKDERIGAVLRSRDRVAPLFISPGHRIDMATSVEWVMNCVTRYRLPETTRWADGIASNRSERWLQQATAQKQASKQT